MTRKRFALIAVLSVALVAAQSSPKGDAEFRLKAYDVHKSMTTASPYKDMSWSFVGPTNISGRMTDIAVADYPDHRRLYAASCCGGLWESDDVGQTWTPVFERFASTTLG